MASLARTILEDHLERGELVPGQENALARPWIQAKDVILELLRRRGVRGGRGCVFEFTGPGVHTLSYTERGTIANMIAELGATGAVFPADDETRAWLEEQERLEDL